MQRCCVEGLEQVKLMPNCKGAAASTLLLQEQQLQEQVQHFLPNKSAVPKCPGYWSRIS